MSAVNRGESGSVAGTRGSRIRYTESSIVCLFLLRRPSKQPPLLPAIRPRLGNRLDGIVR